MLLRRLRPSNASRLLTIANLHRCCSTNNKNKSEINNENKTQLDNTTLVGETTEKGTSSDGKSLTHLETNLENNNNNKEIIKEQENGDGFLQPSNDIVLEYARHALKREGRDKTPEAVVWKWETTYSPILSKGKQNFYDYTDDIPTHVKPFWHHEYYQQREYFRLQRERRPLKEKLKISAIILACLTLAGSALTLFRVWVGQPKEIRELREQLLQQSYGKVLELAAGHGQNIGAYPYAVHEIILCDSNPHQLQALRYRIPQTSYPKYDIRRVRSENLDMFNDGEFDCVIDMFGLCHLHDPVMALRQMQRVVKPSGLILLLEHGSSPYPPVNMFLNYFEHRHKVNTHGCRWNAPIREYLKEARLEIKEIKNMHYGTTYYVVAYPEVLEAYKTRENGASANTPVHVA